MDLDLRWNSVSPPNATYLFSTKLPETPTTWNANFLLPRCSESALSTAVTWCRSTSPLNLCGPDYNTHMHIHIGKQHSKKSSRNHINAQRPKRSCMQGLSQSLKNWMVHVYNVYLILSLRNEIPRGPPEVPCLVIYHINCTISSSSPCQSSVKSQATRLYPVPVSEPVKRTDWNSKAVTSNYRDWSYLITY